ncbi:transaldolase [Candidatus Roizmanbacteria bacterium]|nr:transaldolase [Candidatus Roizmanbacteria bacterium]
MRPANLKTKIFLDSGDPNETKQVISLLGFLDGQTTNPTLVAKNPKSAEKLAKGEKFKEQEVYAFYKDIVQEISYLIPSGSVSVEVPANKETTHQHMLAVGNKMFSWIPNAHIKFPTNTEGLTAAELGVKEGIRINMTLCFSQEQAAAVYSATKSSIGKESLSDFKNVFVSPFVGRLDDKGQNAMDLIKNIVQMYKNSDHHVSVLSASVRNLSHLLYALALGADIVTVPFKILKEWAEKGLQMPNSDFVYNSGNLSKIPYKELDLNANWHQYNIFHELTDAGIDKFDKDWNTLIQK